MQSNNLPLKRFNVLVYCLLINELNQILVSDEAFLNGTLATKFPGGGLELGEGLIDGLKREFVEETGIAVEIKSHFYTTDFFVRSMFSINSDSQIISIYYLVSSDQWRNIKYSEKKFDFEFIQGREAESFRWVPLNRLSEEETITLPIDQVVVQKLLEQFKAD